MASETKKSATPVVAEKKKRGGPKGPRQLPNMEHEVTTLPNELVGMFGPVQRSAYDVKLDQLISQTKASASPESVAFKFSDAKAKNGLRNRAKEKGITLEFLDDKNSGGFFVRISPKQTVAKTEEPKVPVQTGPVGSIA